MENDYRYKHGGLLKSKGLHSQVDELQAIQHMSWDSSTPSQDF